MDSAIDSHEVAHRALTSGHKIGDLRISVNKLLTSGAGQFLLLVGLGLLFYLINEHPQFQPRDGELSAQVPLLPISMVVWHTGGWLLFSGVLWASLGSRPHHCTPVSNKGVCRIAMAVVALVFAIEIGARLSVTGFLGLEQYGSVAGVPAAAVGGLVCLGLLWRWPPTPPVLVSLLLGGGVVIRAIWFTLANPTPQHSDNLFVIRLGLERLMAGETPYAYFDFGTHTNPMPYLPWTFLSYVPPFAAGFDLRIVSFTLSLVILLVLWMIFRSLPLTPTVRNRLMLALGVFYVLPLSISLDEQTEFSLYNLMLVSTFGLVALQRFRLAAVAYGFALGAMPVAVFCAVPLLCFAIRTQSRRQVVVLGSIAFAIAAVPMLIFLIWDAHAFLWAVSYVPREAWGSLDRGLWAEAPSNAIAWHALGGWLRLVQVGFLLLFSTLAWLRLHTVYDLIALSAGGYLALVLSGPYVGPHLVQVVLFLAVLAKAIGAARFNETSLDAEHTVPERRSTQQLQV